jgi:hypothetical protein
MTPLRRRMIDDMTLRNFTKATIDAYVRCAAVHTLIDTCKTPVLPGPRNIRAAPCVMSH